ncbi:hypothetical protein [Nannocystis radixulma]|uniref:Uncharacterized protein n=1 Tax=Nannocystis radixulma TaxID=2995305 RepID=A0ABT5BKM2_9BACT|nr:hypothetical protein [Nannocystis radixulma]MDC0673973.1 hypothetical protein [Nannocystis radixulma]
MYARPFVITLFSCALAACGDSGRADDSASATTPVSTTTSAASTTIDSPTSSTTTDALTGTTSSAATTSTTDEPTGTTAVNSTSTTLTTTVDPSTSTTSPDFCDPQAVADTTAFTYVKKFDTGIPDMVLQASFYNGDADEVMIMSFSGKARRFTTDGTPKGDVIDVPPEALPQLDGATYDAKQQRGLLINQSCILNEVDPVTLAVLEPPQQLGFGMSICAGLALGLDDNLYIASYGSDELVVLSRDGMTEIRRVDMPGQVGLTGFDGIALIAGSENFLVMSTAPDARAAIIDPLGAVVVPATKLGLAEAPLLGGAPMLPDAVLTLCGNGHAWLCEAYDATCFDYAPDDGDKDACGCLIPQ